MECWFNKKKTWFEIEPVEAIQMQPKPQKKY